MRLSAILSEICRNIGTGTSRALVLCSGLAVMLLALVVTDAANTARLARAARTFDASGAAVVTLALPGRISGAACDALNALPEVAAAGALRATPRQLVLATMPDTPVPVFETTSGLARVLRYTPFGPEGVVLARDVLAAAGPPSARSVQTDRGRLTVAGSYSYPADGRRPGFGWAALAASPAVGRFDECWVATSPPQPRVRQLLLGTIAADQAVGLDPTTIELTQLNGRLGDTFTGADEYASRLTRYAPLLSSAAGLLAAIVAARMRRLELAARRHDGASRPDVMWMMVGEGLAWSLPSALVAGAGGVLIAAALGGADAHALAYSALVTAGAAPCGVLLGTLASVGLIRETQLFRYFQER